jgi:uracil-DNA glycosylase
MFVDNRPAQTRHREERARMVPTEFGVPALLTVHPSALLRQPDASKKETDFAASVEDLRKMRSGIRRDKATRPGPGSVATRYVSPET